MIELSDACKRGDHEHCDGLIYRENKNGMMEVIGPCQCGCHAIKMNMKGKDVEMIITVSRKEENDIFDRLAERFRKFAEAEGNVCKELDEWRMEIFSEGLERGLTDDKIEKLLNEWFKDYPYPPDDLDELIMGVLE
ncbi:MAG: hypothetical protein ACP5RE_04190 [Candidatus Acidifodinimicrobium sp.]